MNKINSFQSHKRTSVQRERDEQLSNPMKPTGLQTICPLTLWHLLPWHPATPLVCIAQPLLYFKLELLFSQLPVKLTSSRCEKEKYLL